MDFLSEITQIVGSERIFAEHAECLCYSRDMSVHQGIPDAVVFPDSTGEIAAIMRVAHRTKTPVTARGAGTSVTGAVLPVQGGLLLDLHRMERILEINRKDFYARLEPGVVCRRLNRILAEDGLMFPPNPGSEAIATIGGMVATNASGHRAFKYGTTRDYVKGLKVVLADGTIIETGTIAPKTSLGYDLTHLFSASEGTLGIMTEVTVRVEPKPAYGALGLAFFGDLTSAGDAVAGICMAGIKLAACEIMDRHSLRVVQDFLGLDLSHIEALLIMETDGDQGAVIGDMNRSEEICRQHGVWRFEWTDDADRREEMMMARGRLVPTLSRIRPGHRLVPIADDFGVPPSKIPETIRRAQAVSKKYDVMISTFGHVGDGNVHTTFVADVRSRDAWNRLRAAAEELITTAIEMKGTLSAEHGTGLTRAPHIEKQLGAAMGVMRKIKRVLDPENILNPGKMGLEGRTSDIYDHFAFQPLIDHPEGANSLGREIDDEVLACIHCGFCRLGCPTFAASHRESRNARGRNGLAFYLMSGAVDPSDEIAAAFYSCTVCQACTVYCPAQIKVDEIVMAVRKKLYQAGFVPASILELTGSILKTGNVFASPRAERIEVYPPALKAKLAAQDHAAAADTLLFMGCVPSYLDMKVVPSLIKPLDAAGVRYTALAADENCCGFPLYLMGSDQFEPHAKELVARIRTSHARDLVTPCAGCYKAFKKLYPQFGELGLFVHHVVDYLERLRDEGRLSFTKGFPKRVTYHDPCDLGRAFKVFDAPRRLLLSIPELDYVEMTRNRLQARCCGGGGGVGAYNPEMAEQMAAERVRDALEVGAEILVSACVACKDNLRKGARSLSRSERGKLKILDITEVVAAAIE